MRAELSVKNEYRIEKHRYYELKHFCLQYPSWKRAYNSISLIGGTTYDFIGSNSDCDRRSDITSRLAERRLGYNDKIQLIEKIAQESDPYLGDYILKGVTEQISYNQLKMRFEIPCGRDMYYNRYRRFFWLLDKARD